MKNAAIRLRWKGMRIVFSAVLLLVMLLTVLPSTSSAADEQAKMIELILDASGSMNGKLQGGERKIDAARKAVSKLMKELNDDVVMGFRAYGHQSPREKHDCQDTEILVPFGAAKQNRDKVASKMKPLSAQGYTPITWVLGKAAEDFPPEFKGQRIIILVSDGKETCEGDPCATAQSLARNKVELVIHTIGFGVDEVTKQQLKCIARVTGGKYFPAQDAMQLAEVLNEAAGTAKTEVSEQKGEGWLEVRGADLSGNKITRADTGEEVGKLGHTKSTIKLQAGIYNVTVGKAVWKSVEVKAGETTVLIPGYLKIEHASLKGHKILDRETGQEHGSVSSLKGRAALMPGEYDVMFGKLAWPVTIKAGETTLLKPGTVEVEHAHYRGHAIRTPGGEVVASVSNTMNWAPLPPGTYTIEIDGKKLSFSLKEGEDKKFQR
ncbi:MAG: VWA domain-containing protein [Thermodesulfovibrionales bacterium]|nr:VWA domain-containing protein [Thermodesulfovibrionales bacterium]